MPDNCQYDAQQNAYEILVKSSNKGQTLRGNMLDRELNDDIEEVNGEYRNYYYWILPVSGRMIKSAFYRTVDISDDLDYIRKPGKPVPYKILQQNDLGDYVYDSLTQAPNTAYSGQNFTKPYYQAADGQYIVTDK